MGRCGEFFENYDGTPTEIHWTEDYENERGKEQLMRIMQIADRNSWIMTGSVLKIMKPYLKDLPKGSLKQVGIKNQHSYTIIDVREVVLDTGEIEYLLFIRNPAGNFYQRDEEIWKGDWSPLSSKWTDKIRKQCNYWLTEEEVEEAKKRGKQELRDFNRKPKEPKEPKPKKKKKKEGEETEAEGEDGPKKGKKKKKKKKDGEEATEGEDGQITSRKPKKKKKKKTPGDEEMNDLERDELADMQEEEDRRPSLKKKKKD